MDFTGIESYIKEKSNGRNLEIILILKSLLEKNSATENSIYQTIQSFLDSHQERLSSSYNKFIGSEQRFFFDDQTSKALSGLINAKVVTSKGDSRPIVSLSCSLEIPERVVLLRICAGEIMRVLKVDITPWNIFSMGVVGNSICLELECGGTRNTRDIFQFGA